MSSIRTLKEMIGEINGGRIILNAEDSSGNSILYTSFTASYIEKCDFKGGGYLFLGMSGGIIHIAEQMLDKYILSSLEECSFRFTAKIGPASLSECQ